MTQAAQIKINDLEAKIVWLEKKLDESNHLLAQIYESGVNLNELEKPVRNYLVDTH